MKKYYSREFVAMVLLASVSSVMAQSNGSLIEEHCDTADSGTVCSRTYSTNTLDAVDTKRFEPIKSLDQVTVVEHIRQLEEAHENHKYPLPYSNDQEKQQYIKFAHYQKLLKKFENTDVKLKSSSESPQILSAGDNAPDERTVMVDVFYKAEFTGSDILKDLNDDEFTLLRESSSAHWLVLSVTRSGLEKLNLNSKVIEITPVAFGS